MKYNTPNGEVNLCGHATISAFTVLRNEKKLSIGNYVAKTLAGNLNVIIEPNLIWLEMVQGKLLKQLTFENSLEVYQAYGLNLKDRPDTMWPCIVNTGLSDILLPVNSKEGIDNAVQNRTEVIKISKKYGVVGVHIFFLASSQGITAYCRNFAPLYGIDEESATGTSNGALTYYLFTLKLVNKRDENIFIQGTTMKKPSVIRSKINSDTAIYIGGNAVISVKGYITF
jgi:PhzF family phenazine biosynthesis protein